MNPFLDFFKVKVFTSSHSSNTEKEKGKKRGKKRAVLPISIPIWNHFIQTHLRIFTKVEPFFLGGWKSEDSYIEERILWEAIVQ